MARDVTDTLQDLEWLAEDGVGLTQAAERTGFGSTASLEVWLRAQDVPLLNRLQKSDPIGMSAERVKPIRTEPKMVTSLPERDLLSRASEHPKAAIRNKAKRASALLDAIRSEVAAYDREQDRTSAARSEVARLEAELAGAKARLRGDKAVVRKASAVTSDAKIIRAWAADNAVECPEFGRIPTAVREAYEAREQAATA